MILKDFCTGACSVQVKEMRDCFYLVIRCILFGICVLSFSAMEAQDGKELTSDEMFIKAREEAFDNDNYAKAIQIMENAVQKAPDYTDLIIFLGRLYTWTDQIEKARNVLKIAFDKEPGYEDAAMAYANMEYWNDNSLRALEIVNSALDNNPDSEKLRILKSKILKDLKRFQEAHEVLNELLENNPKSSEARSLIQSIKWESAVNQIGVFYDFVYFDKRFDQPWHLAGLDYTRQTKLGSIAGRVNYANRFGSGATQFEMDMYPRISNTFYAYVNGGISNDEGIFPKYRTGFSLFSNLPASFEADAGFRWLYFSNSTWVYTFSVGKYYKNYWFNFRTYLTPSDAGFSNSYGLTVRYYFGGAEDFVSLKLGTGFSPDNAANNVLINGNTRLTSTNLSLGYRKLLGKTHIVFANIGYENIEYASDSRGNQFTIGIGYNKRF